MKLRVAVACRDANGCAAMPVFDVEADEQEQLDGCHYLRAEEMASQSGYEKPFLCFDGSEQPAILKCAYDLGIATQVVAIDMTGGAIHSVRADAGDIRVICYDTDDLYESDLVEDRPLGSNGEMITCWACDCLADEDPHLAKLL